MSSERSALSGNVPPVGVDGGFVGVHVTGQSGDSCCVRCSVPTIRCDGGFVVVHFAGQAVDVGFIVCNVLAIRCDVGFVDLHSRGQSNDITIYAHHIRCLVEPFEAGTLYPGESVRPSARQ